MCKNLIDSKSLTDNNKVNYFKILIKFIEQVISDFSSSVRKKSEEIDKKDLDDSRETEFEPHVNFFRINSDSNFTVDLDMKNYLNIFNVIYSYLEQICEDFRNTSENTQTYFTSFDEEIPKLGLYRIYEFEYIQLIFELLMNVLNNNNLNQFEIVIKNIDILIDKFIELKVFDTVVKYFFLYEWNSVYQNIFRKLVSFVICSNVPERLINNFFVDSKFIEKSIEHCFASGISFKSGSTIFPGNFANLCELISIINKSENSNLKSILSNCK